MINVSHNLTVIAQDPQERYFTVSAETDKNVLILHVKFPPNYPNQKAPVFSFLQGTTVDHSTRNNILAKLRTVAKQQISKNRRCLESCLRQFESCLSGLSDAEEEQLKLNNPGQVFSKTEITLENREDEKIPYPRSSGARFCKYFILKVYYFQESIFYSYYFLSSNEMFIQVVMVTWCVLVVLAATTFLCPPSSPTPALMWPGHPEHSPP